MAIISNKTWEKFTQEEKENIQSLYRQYKVDFDDNKSKKLHTTAAIIERGLDVIDTLIGKENLQTKPKIRTWEDIENVEKENDFYANYINFYKTDNGYYCLDVDKSHNTKVIQKAIATLKISKLIELGYGGIVTEEDNKDQSQMKYFICPRNNGEMRIIEMSWLVDKILGFYSRQQAEEFMSYQDNVELIKQYYLI